MQSITKILNITTAWEHKRMVICSAIRQLRTLEFYYHGGYRTVEPFALGIVRNGKADNESLICYQTGGFSELREVAGWKLYRVSEMEDIEGLKEKFTDDRPGYDPDHVEMAKIIYCVRPVKKAEEDVKETPEEQLKVESSPATTPRAPEVKPKPIIRNLSHNELMERFRYAHPLPIPQLDTTLWREPLVAPFPEHVKSNIWLVTPVFGNIDYLLGQKA